ncbi:hypothetical protein E1B28_005606 [Marasmius oreades]|uniref:Uncharacterized protein n=1 Tax=Marasmius oreades TaxID=181124 RepID=A0A9P7S4X3_9AGAR|nr:uncharacterized protein E1B28_005606 [Marasmius oreades]KAG7094791.1 hypothetical protein E1B28_005606 [Marasmius oreades]
MSSRSFTVFQDTPVSDTPHHKDPSLSPTLSPLTSSTMHISANLGPVTATDKENLDPITGEPVVASGTNGKKRKTSVLATKSLTPLGPVLKDVKDSVEGQPETKKRKSSVSSGSKPKVKKDGKGLGSGKKTATKKSTRKALTMPKVDEEVDIERDAREQALVDSRCRDLTVSPLADVSEAYIKSSVFGEVVLERPVSEDSRWLSKESSCEPDIRDYLTTAHLSASTSSSTLRGSSPACEPAKVFSTPERKRIYSAFTFQSPSPARTRLHKKSSDSIHIGPLNFGELDDTSS